MVAGDSGYSSGVAPETVLRSFCFKGLRALFPSKLSRLTGKCGASKNYSERPAACPRTVQGVPFHALRSDLSYGVRFRGALGDQRLVSGTAPGRKPTLAHSLAPKQHAIAQD